MTLEAGNAYTITWSGGAPAPTGQVVLRYSIAGGDLFSGFGIPQDPITNTGSFSWVLEAGIAGGTISTEATLIIFSATASYNYAAGPTGHFTVDGTAPPPNAAWAVSGGWGSCTRPCGGGTMTRTVVCANDQNQIVSNSQCNAGTKLPTTASCNSGACQTQCPAVGPCADGTFQCTACYCGLQSGEQAGGIESCRMQVQSGNMAGMVFGCDITGGQTGACCTNQGLHCEDGCTGKVSEDCAREREQRERTWISLPYRALTPPPPQHIMKFQMINSRNPAHLTGSVA